MERTAADVLRHYERTNRAVGKERDAVIRLLRVREAMDAKDAGRIEQALEVRNSTGSTEHIVADVLMCGSSWNLRTLSRWRRMLRRSRNGQRNSRICRTRYSATCRSSSRSPWTFLLLCTRRSRPRLFRMFRGKRCVSSYTVRCLIGLLTWLLDNCVASQKVEGAHHLCGEPQVQDVTRRVLVPGTLRCRDCFVVAIVLCCLFHDARDSCMFQCTDSGI